MGFYLFGHGLYEKALQPFVGLTGRCVILPVENGFLANSLFRQLEDLDSLLANHVSDANQFANTSDTIPLPLLGIPGWSSDNEMEDYYSSETYFRKSG